MAYISSSSWMYSSRSPSTSSGFSKCDRLRSSEACGFTKSKEAPMFMSTAHEGFETQLTYLGIGLSSGAANRLSLHVSEQKSAGSSAGHSPLNPTR